MGRVSHITELVRYLRAYGRCWAAFDNASPGTSELRRRQFKAGKTRALERLEYCARQLGLTVTSAPVVSVYKPPSFHSGETTVEYVLISYTSPQGEVKTCLVEMDTFKDGGSDPNFFIVRPDDCTDIETHGTVTIEGDNDHMLDNTYES